MLDTHINHLNRNVLKSIEDNLDFTSEKLRVLDVGCGSGTWLMVSFIPHHAFNRMCNIIFFY